jgi:hypothetical protein
MEIKTQTSQASQIEYDVLLEQRAEFQQAGMTAKVAEWDYKIKTLEIANMKDENGNQKYPVIDFAYIAKELGIEGLNQQLRTNERVLKEQVRKYCGKLYDKPQISGRELDEVYNSKWQWSNDEKMTKEIMKHLTPKLRSKTDRDLYAKVFMLDSRDENDGNQYLGVKAFIKVQRLADYIQNDNPPKAELYKIIEGNTSNLFHCLYIAYPMIKEHKEIDPIVFGVLQDPTKSYDTLDDTNNEWGMSNSEITLDNLNWSVNLGIMHNMAQWV